MLVLLVSSAGCQGKSYDSTPSPIVTPKTNAERTAERVDRFDKTIEKTWWPLIIGGAIAAGALFYFVGASAFMAALAGSGGMLCVTHIVAEFAGYAHALTIATIWCGMAVAVACVWYKIHPDYQSFLAGIFRKNKIMPSTPKPAILGSIQDTSNA